ncbi:MAG: hypothetical protein N2050_07330 [Flavobacteriales bacterium]|nr:hypothetical protein [Flavobacteriales bacterium]MCX7650347.1 hypothetical protein [Flavobacteriales bacterium]MDW8431625.1 hypothetical protein [Flavobacteriales bacterium]
MNNQSAMDNEKLSAVLHKYLPAQAVPWAVQKLKYHGIQLRITGFRQSKLGDYRPPKAGEPHKISINYNLNPQSFAVTLVHEVAHLETHLRYGHSVAPHGPQWQERYAILLREVGMLGAFSPEVFEYMAKSGFRHGATACSDPHLLRLLRKYDTPWVSGLKLLEQLAPGDCFITAGGRLFRKGPLRRTKYVCTCLRTGREYLIHYMTEVRPLNQKV